MKLKPILMAWALAGIGSLTLSLPVSVLAQSAAESSATATNAASNISSKKALVNKILQLQRPGIEGMAQQLAEQPAAQMMQQAATALNRVPESQRQATGKAIQAEIQKYVAEAVPLVQERAIKLAPSVSGSLLEEQFSEEELKQLLAWFESPLNKKYAQTLPTINDSLVKKLIEDAKPAVNPKLASLEQNVRKILDNAVGASAAAGAASSVKPAKSASKSSAAAAK